MKKYLDILTAHFKEVAKCQTFSCAESELERIYQEKRKEFLNNFFRKLADKNNAIYQYFEEHDDYVLVSMRFRDPKYPNGDDPSKYKLYPFQVLVAECLSKKRAEANLDMVETTWINQLSESLGEQYDSEMQAFEDSKAIKPE